jgi:hypothetical protein
MTTDLDLTKYKALSFDCYGTLIDWEAGIAAVLAPWAREQGLDVSDEDLLLAYADNEAAVERETPTALYPDVLAIAFRRTGDRLQRPVSDGGRSGSATRSLMRSGGGHWGALILYAASLATVVIHCLVFHGPQPRWARPAG